MQKKILGILSVVLLLGLAGLPARADVSSSRAVPGALNYVEGQASIGPQSVTSQSVGATVLQPNQVLTTGAGGKTEILLTPGVYLRVGSDSAVKMVSPSLTNTQVEVERGEAQVEVDQIYQQNDLQVLEGPARVVLQKRGVYDFDANQQVVRVLDGQAWLQDGDTRVKIKGGHEVALNDPALKSRGFNKSGFEATDDLYRWSSLRSAYLAQANVDEARTLVVNGAYGPGWWGPGWYWDPWFGAYTFVPGDGFLFSPFGWGFYSPVWAYRAPGFYYGHFYHSFNGAYPAWGYARGPWGRGVGPGFRGGAPVARWGGPAGGGFHGGGDFHGGGGRGGAFR
jgi:FecR protein